MVPFLHVSFLSSSRSATRNFVLILTVCLPRSTFLRKLCGPCADRMIPLDSWEGARHLPKCYGWRHPANSITLALPPVGLKRYAPCAATFSPLMEQAVRRTVPEGCQHGSMADGAG